MIFPLLLLSLAPPAPSNRAATAVGSDDPPAKVWLDRATYRRGDKARVHVRLGQDGYLVVLRADGHGRVRVLYPLDPGNDAFVRRGQTLEVRGRGDREAFSVDEREGSGLVLAARSVTLFKVDEFARGDHWDYRELTARDAGEDKEQALLDIVQHMVPGGHFDYDVVSYTVARPRAYYDGAYNSYSSSVGLGLGYGFGRPRRFSFSLAFGDPFLFRPFFFRAGCFDPFFFDPFVCDPFFFHPLFVPRRFLFPSVFVFSRTVIVVRGGIPVVAGLPVRRGLLADRAGPGFRGRFLFRDPTPISGTGRRLRVPTAAALRRARSADAAAQRSELMSGLAEPSMRDRPPNGAPRLPAPRIENRARGTAPQTALAIGDPRQRTMERRMPGPARRAPDRFPGTTLWRAAERPREPGWPDWGPGLTHQDRGFSWGRPFVRSRAAGSLRRGSGRRR
jgi:hypothetical protein